MEEVSLFRRLFDAQMPPLIMFVKSNIAGTVTRAKQLELSFDRREVSLLSSASQLSSDISCPKLDQKTLKMEAKNTCSLTRPSPP